MRAIVPVAALMFAGGAWAQHGPANTAPPRFSVAEIPHPSEESLVCDFAFSSSTYARRMNDNGQAVGHTECYAATGDPAAPYLPRGFRAFAWSAPTGTFSLPAPPSGAEPYIRDINRSGTAFGGTLARESVVLWTLGGGVSEIFDDAPCSPFGALMLEAGINDAGSVAYTTRRYDSAGLCSFALVLRRPGGVEIVQPVDFFRGYALNNDEVAVGTDGAGQAVKWSPALGLVVLSANQEEDIFRIFSVAWNLNQRGDVVGFVYPAEGCSRSHALMWPTEGGETSLAKLSGAPFSAAYAINEARSIVGFSHRCTDGSDSRATLWQAGRVWDLNDLIPQRLHVQLVQASSINGSGQILAQGFRRDEPMKPCPRWEVDLETEEVVYNSSLMCRSGYSYVLTPRTR